MIVKPLPGSAEWTSSDAPKSGVSKSGTLEIEQQLGAKAVGTDVKEKGTQRVVVKHMLGSAGTGASKSGVSKSGTLEI